MEEDKFDVDVCKLLLNRRKGLVKIMNNGHIGRDSKIVVVSAHFFQLNQSADILQL